MGVIIADASKITEARENGHQSFHINQTMLLVTTFVAVLLLPLISDKPWTHSRSEPIIK